MVFKLKTEKIPSGDQPAAIEKLYKNLVKMKKEQTLLGITGSGKTFTSANVINKFKKQTLVIAHNKTLAAQLYQEYKELFPNNEVHYFVSYYDYYQPEAYMSISDTYIEKEAQINKEIDRLRHASTQALLTRDDVIIVSSVSCIYGLGSPERYKEVNLHLIKNKKITREELIKKLIILQFERTNSELTSGKFRVVGDFIEVFPVNEEIIFRIEIILGKIKDIISINYLTREIKNNSVKDYFLFPAKHFVSSKKDRNEAVKTIKQELDKRLHYFDKNEKIIEKERLRRRTLQDISLIRDVGYCGGIENYSIHFDKRNSGEPPYTLLDYFNHDKDGNPDFLTIIDESHITIPQLNGMYMGDKARKESLVEYGFRLPTAKDNRPLTFDEFYNKINEVIYISATPSHFELEKSGVSGRVEQIIRPTGLLDPILEVHKITSNNTYGGQIKDVIKECKKEIKNDNRILITTLTKKTAEELSEYLNENTSIKTKYLHSDIKTIERVEILTQFRRGEFDCVVGVNLLREGLDLPEVSLVAILDADKEGFLRSEVSLIQTIGRASRNVNGRVILYADKITQSLKKAIEITRGRREKQAEYNKKHKITPKTIKKEIRDITSIANIKNNKISDLLLNIDIDIYKKNPKKFLAEKDKKMSEAVERLDFETAAILRDEIKKLKELI